MAPESWPPNRVVQLLRSVKNHRHPHRDEPCSWRNGAADLRQDGPVSRGRWRWVGAFRRLILVGLVLAQTAVATYFMTAVLPYHGGKPLEIVSLAPFAVLTGWVSVGFWTAMMGFLLLLFGARRSAICRAVADDASVPEDARTAIIMPICNEDVRRVFAGLRATYDSLSRSGQGQTFDFFVLSDSSDPDLRVAEIGAWARMRRQAEGAGRVFYRWRRHRMDRDSAADEVRPRQASIKAPERGAGHHLGLNRLMLRGSAPVASGNPSWTGPRDLPTPANRQPPAHMK